MYIFFVNTCMPQTSSTVVLPQLIPNKNNQANYKNKGLNFRLLQQMWKINAGTGQTLFQTCLNSGSFQCLYKQTETMSNFSLHLSLTELERF